eukprot:scaffold61172_cov31-Prasinocladus_malaysianus.AAC.1
MPASPPPPSYPAPKLLSTPDELSGSAAAEFRFATEGCSDNLSDCMYICSLESGPPFDCESPLVLKRLQEGQHSFSVYTDAKADVAASSIVEHFWVVDTVGPSLSLSQRGPPTYLPTKLTLEMVVVASEPLSVPLAADRVVAVNASCESVKELTSTSFLVTLRIDPVWPEPT